MGCTVLRGFTHRGGGLVFLFAETDTLPPGSGVPRKKRGSTQYRAMRVFFLRTGRLPVQDERACTGRFTFYGYSSEDGERRIFRRL